MRQRLDGNTSDLFVTLLFSWPYSALDGVCGLDIGGS